MQYMLSMLHTVRKDVIIIVMSYICTYMHAFHYYISLIDSTGLKRDNM